MQQRLEHDLGEFSAPQKAFAVTAVEMPVPQPAALLFVLGLELHWYRFRIRQRLGGIKRQTFAAKPLAQLVLPLFDDFARHGISGAERDENGDTRLKPVRQIPRTLFRFRLRIVQPE